MCIAYCRGHHLAGRQRSKWWWRPGDWSPLWPYHKLSFVIHRALLTVFGSLSLFYLSLPAIILSSCMSQGGGGASDGGGSPSGHHWWSISLCHCTHAFLAIDCLLHVSLVMCIACHHGRRHVCGREEVERVMVEAQGSTQITFPLVIPPSPDIVSAFFPCRV